jgi:acetyl-CoA acetyltransferase family protein
MRSAVIVDAVRTGTGKGKPGGGLSGVHAVELLRQTLEGLVDRAGIDPGTVEDVMIGCVSQYGEQAACPGRIAWLGAGFPPHVPATTIDRRCGSGQQAVHFAAQSIMAGSHDVVIAGGVEVMSRVPMGSARGTADVFGESIQRRYAPGLVSQGISAELVAAKWGITRDEMDAYSIASHERAAEARATGHFAREIIPVDLMDGSGSTFDHDETIRPGTSMERLSELPTVFRTEADEARFPEITWSVTPGNSSQLADGASALLITSEDYAQRMGLSPRARIAAMSVVGDDPILMLTGPIAATRVVLERSGLSVDDIDAAEVNEAFASVPLAWQREFGFPMERLNPRGGAIALGHPLGASGTRIMTTLLNHLESTGGRYGLQTMCEGSGMANATIIERI